MSEAITKSGKARVLAVVMGGGQGARLFPLTKDRAKPAVPLAGKYRLVDIPISNCINCQFNQVYLLTQFNSASLHRHISHSYKFDHFSRGFVELLAAEQTPTNTSWYQGTADAVRQNLGHFLSNDFEYMLVLSGDQLYRMDFRDVLARHIDTGADLTVATIPVARDKAPSFGIMHTEATSQIRRFVEKPSTPELLDSLKLSDAQKDQAGVTAEDDQYLASMGIYIFNRTTLIELLDNELTDFGKHIIPRAIGTHKVYSFVYQGYWEDIGTIGAFFQANLDIVSERPPFNLFDMKMPVFTRPRFLPASKINGAAIDHAMISDGSIINHSRISQSIIGVRGIISSGCRLHRVIMLGSDYYDAADSATRNQTKDPLLLGVGENTRIENAIIDKNARIGRDCVISPEGKPKQVDHELYFIRDGIVIIPRNSTIPHDTVI